MVVPFPGQVPFAPTAAAVDQVPEVGQAVTTLPLASGVLAALTDVHVTEQVAVGEVK